MEGEVLLFSADSAENLSALTNHLPVEFKVDVDHPVATGSWANLYFIAFLTIFVAEETLKGKLKGWVCFPEDAHQEEVDPGEAASTGAHREQLIVVAISVISSQNSAPTLLAKAVAARVVQSDSSLAADAALSLLCYWLVPLLVSDHFPAGLSLIDDAEKGFFFEPAERVEHEGPFDGSAGYFVLF